DWGDGTTTPGVVTGPTGGPFTVNGSHTYADEGTFTVIASFSDDPPSALTNIPIIITSFVSEADTLTGTGATFSVTEGQAFTGEVATFTDTNLGAQPSDFSANIDWGDGTIDVGVPVTGSPGGPFTVNGTHTYAEDGIFHPVVTIFDDAPGTATADATATATVAEGFFA